MSLPSRNKTNIILITADEGEVPREGGVTWFRRERFSMARRTGKASRRRWELIRGSPEGPFQTRQTACAKIRKQKKNGFMQGERRGWDLEGWSGRMGRGRSGQGNL